MEEVAVTAGNCRALFKEVSANGWAPLCSLGRFSFARVFSELSLTGSCGWAGMETVQSTESVGEETMLNASLSSLSLPSFGDLWSSETLSRLSLVPLTDCCRELIQDTSDSPSPTVLSGKLYRG